MNENIQFRLFSSLVIIIFLSTTSRAVTISTVPVGGPGNAPDSATGYGAVPYAYRIGTFDVTYSQYAEFLNEKAATADPYGLWNSSLDAGSSVSHVNDGGIVRSVAAGTMTYSYSARSGYAFKPVIYVSWYDAVRFVNWLTNGQGNGDTESGTYTITNGGSNSGIVTIPDVSLRANWAAGRALHWLLPSEDEWYKAAYFNGTAGTYYVYPFQSNRPPIPLAPPGNANSGNFSNVSAGPPPAFNYDGQGSYLTSVGAYSDSQSPFGSFDMGGDVFQWDEALIGSNRGQRGGYWNYPTGFARSTLRFSDAPTIESYGVGFRVASVGIVPEPATIVMAVIGFVGSFIFRNRGLAIPHRHLSQDARR